MKMTQAEKNSLGARIQYEVCNAYRGTINPRPFEGSFKQNFEDAFEVGESRTHAQDIADNDPNPESAMMNLFFHAIHKAMTAEIEVVG